MRFREQVVVVTGAGRGLGLALAERFAAEGAKVVIAESDAAGGGAAAQRLGGSFVPLEVHDAEAVTRAVDGIGAQHGRIDVWVNHANVAHQGSAVDLAPAQWDAALGVLLSGAYYCARAVGKVMIAQGRGAMVNVASVYGLLAQKAAAPTCVANAGLIMLTQVLAAEWGPHGVRVNAVAPGVVVDERAQLGNDQELITETAYLSRIPMGRLGEVSEIVEAVTFLASDDASFMTGSVMRVDGGWSGYHLFYPYETAFQGADER
jgi:NAD(P)-dependent dehydrogenase (short-subunit alcohol dehydrogenase family)